MKSYVAERHSLDDVRNNSDDFPIRPISTTLHDQLCTLPQQRAGRETSIENMLKVANDDHVTIRIACNHV